MTRNADEWLAELGKAGIPCGPINRMDEVFSDEHVRHLQMVLESRHPQVGMIRMVRNPVTFSRTPVDLRQVPPRLGEQTEEVLCDLLGYSAAGFAGLRAAGSAVALPAPISSAPRAISATPTASASRAR